MRRPYRALARVLGVGMLAGAAACAVDDPGYPRGFPEAAGDETTASASPTSVSPTAASTPTLTADQARSALIREDDLGGAWSGTGGAATWRDGLLKGRTDRPECQELLDAVYAEDLLGESRGGTAVTGFDDDEYGSQLRYQVGAYDRAHLDARLGHFRHIMDKCGEFTITGLQGREYGAEVTPIDVPGSIGDARQGLRLVISGDVDVDGDDGALTLDLVAVRVGDTAALLTHGGLYGIDDTTTQEATEAGVERLQDLLREEKKKKENKAEKKAEKKKTERKAENKSERTTPSPSPSPSTTE